MLENSELGFILQLFERTRKIGSEQPLVRRYFELTSNCLNKINETENVLEEFGKLSTDFERVCYFLKHLRTHSEAREAVKPDGVQKVKKDLTRCNGKSDILSKLFRLRCLCAQRSSRFQLALHYATLSVFYAKSKDALYSGFANRSIILYEIGLIDEAINDANRALKGSFTPFDTAKLCICLGSCYKHRGKMREAVDKFLYAIFVLEESDPRLGDYIKLQAESQIREIYELNWNKLICSNTKCIYPKAKVSELKKFLRKGNCVRANRSCELPASNGTLALKDTKSKLGWTLEVTRDVKPGEVLAVEKCYAASLPSRWSRLCCSCFQRCHNPLPCDGCPLVGFCSERCARDAFKSNCRSSRCINKHVYACEGLLICTFLDTYASWSGFGQEYGSSATAQTALACVANTDPSRLLDYICSTGVYQGGRGHQAFIGEKSLRSAPPRSIDPSDYSSVAILTAGPDKHPTEFLLQSTIASIFLTYCLYIGGYPMKWCDIDLYALPTSEHRPQCIPASWMAACILYHIQAVDLNAFNLDLSLGQSTAAIVKNFTVVGAMLYPTISLINHSCNPSALLVMARRGVGCLTALQPLTRGSEISLQYNGNFYANSKEERQERLKSFYFECTCEACVKDWKYPSDSNEVLICPLCRTHFCSTLEACPSCSSTSGAEGYRKLWDEDFPKIYGHILNGDVNLEIIKTAAGALDRAQSLLKPPSRTIRRASVLFGHSMVIRYGDWVVEPWPTFYPEVHF